uniref:Uncharacterized protein n=1 Tax=Arundo donax TaxID=35708 RepID=A0A0A9H803_ARUDO
MTTRVMLRTGSARLELDMD